jgi:hypothetical protein
VLHALPISYKGKFYYMIWGIITQWSDVLFYSALALMPMVQQSANFNSDIIKCIVGIRPYVYLSTGRN